MMEDNEHFNVRTLSVGKDIVQGQHIQNGGAQYDVSRSSLTSSDSLSSEKNENPMTKKQTIEYPAQDTGHCGTIEEFFLRSDVARSSESMKNKTTNDENQLYLTVQSSSHVSTTADTSSKYWQTGELDDNSRIQTTRNKSDSEQKSMLDQALTLQNEVFSQVEMSVEKTTSDVAVVSNPSALQLKSEININPAKPKPSVAVIEKTRNSPRKSDSFIPSTSPLKVHTSVSSEFTSANKYDRVPTLTDSSQTSSLNANIVRTPSSPESVSRCYNVNSKNVSGLCQQNTSCTAEGNFLAVQSERNTNISPKLSITKEDKPFLKSWEEKFISMREISRKFEPKLQHVSSIQCEHSDSLENSQDVHVGISTNERNILTLPESHSEIENDQNIYLKNLEKHQNKENQQQTEKEISIKDRDPFELSPNDDDNSQEKYQPVKRKSEFIDHGIVEENTDQLKKKAKIVEAEHLQDNSVSEVVEDKTERKSLQCGRRVVYIHSDELMVKTNKLIKIEGRAELVHSLISSYGLLKYCSVIPPRFASESEMFGFHSPEYINFLRDISEREEDSDSATAEAENYGLAYDCPIQEGIFDTVSLIAGGTIVGAESLINGNTDVAINWHGGWHHGKRDCASGFCYINDIVLGILKLREKFDKILYVDLDLHHGDGVEEAFCMTNKVMTVSFHKCSPGFFPGSGAVDDIGSGRGKYFTVNVPLLDGLQDNEFTYVVFKKVMTAVLQKFKAEAIVIQCGADGMSEDPMNSFNLTHLGIARCVDFMLSWKLPTLLLGGGGYNFPNTAKCWTYLTSLAVGKKLPVSIPEHQHFMSYSPLFELMTHEGNRKNWNSKQYIQELLYKVYGNLRNL